MIGSVTFFFLLKDTIILLLSCYFRLSCGRDSGVTHLIFTAMQKRSAVGNSSPNAHACRSRRGEAPEGSSLLSPRVEARSAEDRGRGCQERYTTPPGCRTYQGVRQPVRHPGGVAGSLVMADPRVFGATPLDPWLRSGHPQGVLRSPPLHNELVDFCATQMRHP